MVFQISLAFSRLRFELVNAVTVAPGFDNL
jgi:hypothetical protein